MLKELLDFLRRPPLVWLGRPYVTSLSFGETEDGKPTKIINYSDGRTAVMDSEDPPVAVEEDPHGQS